MVSWIEIGFFAYALLGSATTGYWLLVSFSPQFRERDRNTKLGYSAIAGLVYAGTIFFVSVALVSGHYNRLNFLETFFWMTPISFVLLALAATGRRAWILVERAQYGEQRVEKQPEEKLGTSILSPQIPSIQKMPQMQAEPTRASPLISDSAQATEPQALDEPEEKIGEMAEEEPQAIEEPGETEKDVVEEIRKIMKSDLTEEEKKEMGEKKGLREELQEKEEIRKVMGTDSAQKRAQEEEWPPIPPKEAPPSALGPTDIEKIKSDLKSKIRAKEAAEKIKEGLKKKETQKG